ncbi:TadE/TadG family type IV pilus assembly protein [Saccharopolyspora endophytica]|uniref:Pilus assembly protein n=1 Tax=Saccharopolyspora endophytica TaxID=543886 RepID=A0ABS5DK67_9PSEU|nr:TadE/TadG family type IV pilus assembly protein [Saccharopolyspora endophytica]MBQ0926686.1 pilus assembly protein [Saccharopolyspora endophytica]
MTPLPLRLQRDERGSVATELTLLVPVLIVLLLFVVFCGRLADSRLRVNDAAHQAVRAATLARSTSQANRDAHATAQAALSQAGLRCQHLGVSARLAGMQPGSTVTVTLTCTIGLSDLAMLGVPGTTTATSTASSVVDQWRGTDPGGGA